MKWITLVLQKGVRLSCGSYLAGFSAPCSGGVAVPLLLLPPGVVRPLVLSVGRGARQAGGGSCWAPHSLRHQIQQQAVEWQPAGVSSKTNCFRRTIVVGQHIRKLAPDLGHLIV